MNQNFRKNINIFIFLILFSIISSSKYPLYKNINESETSNIKTILIHTKEQYLNYILNNKYVISLAYFQLYEKEPPIFSIFDKLSSYNILKNWIFLKIECLIQNDLCNLLSLNTTNKLSPSIKIYIKSNLLITSDILLNFDVADFLEYLIKLSTESLIEINEKNISKFYNEYEKFSPVIYYDKINTEFISCINMLSKKKYFQYYFFGIYSINDSNKEKERIIFDNNNLPISFTWDGDCDDVVIFLEQNKYPLINKADKLLIHYLSIEPKILVILIGNISTNSQVNKFINKEYKKLAYMHRDLVFSVVDNKEDNFFVDKYKKYLNDIESDNNMKLIFYDFHEDIYYIHPKIFTFSKENEKYIYEEMNNLIINLSSFPFTSGSLFKDLMRKTGLNKIINDKKQMAALGSSIIIIILGCLYLILYGKQNNKIK